MTEPNYFFQKLYGFAQSKMPKLSLLFLVFLISPIFLLAQSGEREIAGVVFDENGEPLPSVTVIVENSTRGVITDVDGTFKIPVSNEDVLVLRYLGYEDLRIKIGVQEKIIATMNPKRDELEDVTVVGFARQKKESVIASVSTINPSELKVPSSNLTSGLAGRMAGLISYQLSGEPGKDNTNFFIRGVTTFGYSASPLILIDNIESTSDDLARLSSDDVAAFSIMKDATATSIYGARGANGVILVTTKEGREGPAKLNIRFENSISTPARNIEFADPITYMNLYNEAKLTRNPSAIREFSDEKIASTAAGGNPYVYPAIDWYDELFKKATMNQRINVNISGGGGVARYYVSANFSNDNGVLKVNNMNNYNNNINVKRISLRSNVNISLTKTTQLDVRVNTNFDNRTGPLDGGDIMYRKVLSASPVHFPKAFAPDENNIHTRHILYGNYGTGNYLNPYADMIKGYNEYSSNMVTAQLQLSQDLSFITEGLKVRLLANAIRNSDYTLSRQTIPFYYSVGYYDKQKDKYTLNQLNPDEGREDLNYTPGTPIVNGKFYYEGAVTYDRGFGNHKVGGLLVGIMSNYVTGNPANDPSTNKPSLQSSLPSRNMGLSGRLTYAYDSRYMLELNFGYNGSERFSKKERFGFFPSAGVGYMISNESFWKKNKYIDGLKFKATYGLVGNDRIGSANDRFFYISQVLFDAGISPIYFGENFTEQIQTISTTRYGNPFISWEVARKLDIGVEMTLFDFLEIHADYFSEKRKNIFQKRANIPAEAGFAADLFANVGRSSSQGFEIQADANKSFGKDLWLGFRGNFTYARSKYDYLEERARPYPWLGETGRPIGQRYGYIAERLFIDDADIANSPKQSAFGTYMPGDIKYRDINGDDIIDGNDIVPIGYPEVPEIIYGFGISVGWKNLDFSCFFQGSARSSFYIDALRTTPFLNAAIADRDIFGDRIAPNNILKTYADSYWSESNRDSYAAQPRLTTEVVNNNIQPSTWYLRDGSYMRLKSVEIGYTLTTKWAEKIRMKQLRVYLSGLNLLTFSKFKDWDVEQGGNGFNYPIQAVYNIGVNINF